MKQFYGYCCIAHWNPCQHVLSEAGVAHALCSLSRLVLLHEVFWPDMLLPTSWRICLLNALLCTGVLIVPDLTSFTGILGIGVTDVQKISCHYVHAPAAEWTRGKLDLQCGVLWASILADTQLSAC